MFKVKSGETAIIETKEYCRVGDREELRLVANKSVYHKRTILPYNRTIKIHNSKNELVAIETHLEKEEIVETVQNRSTGTTIVIVRDKKGNRYKGVSKCNKKEDIFMVQDGYAIAYARAMSKKFEAILKRYLED